MARTRSESKPSFKKPLNIGEATYRMRKLSKRIARDSFQWTELCKYLSLQSLRLMHKANDKYAALQVRDTLITLKTKMETRAIKMGLPSLDIHYEPHKPLVEIARQLPEEPERMPVVEQEQGIYSEDEDYEDSDEEEEPERNPYILDEAEETSNEDSDEEAEEDDTSEWFLLD